MWRSNRRISGSQGRNWSDLVLLGFYPGKCMNKAQNSEQERRKYVERQGFLQHVNRRRLLKRPGLVLFWCLVVLAHVWPCPLLCLLLVSAPRTVFGNQVPWLLLPSMQILRKRFSQTRHRYMNGKQFFHHCLISTFIPESSLPEDIYFGAWCGQDRVKKIFRLGVFSLPFSFLLHLGFSEYLCLQITAFK